MPKRTVLGMASPIAAAPAKPIADAAPATASTARSPANDEIAVFDALFDGVQVTDAAAVANRQGAIKITVSEPPALRRPAASVVPPLRSTAPVAANTAAAIHAAAIAAKSVAPAAATPAKATPAGGSAAPSAPRRANPFAATLIAAPSPFPLASMRPTTGTAPGGSTSLRPAPPSVAPKGARAMGDAADEFMVDFSRDGEAVSHDADTLRPPEPETPHYPAPRNPPRASATTEPAPTAEAPAAPVSAIPVSAPAPSMPIGNSIPVDFEGEDTDLTALTMSPWRRALKVARSRRALIAVAVVVLIAVALLFAQALRARGATSEQARMPEQLAAKLVPTAAHADPAPVAVPMDAVRPAAVLAAAPAATTKTTPAKPSALVSAPVKPSVTVAAVAKPSGLAKPSVPAAVAPAPAAKRAAPATPAADVDDIGALPPLASSDRSAANLAAREAQIAEAKKLVRQAGVDRANGRLPVAEAEYLKALNLLPRYPLAVAGLVRIHLERREPSESLRWAKMLIAIQANRGNNQLMLGDAYALAGRMDDARKAWTQSKRYGNAVARARLAK